MSSLEQAFALPWLWLVAGLIVAGMEIVLPGVMMLWAGLGAMLVGVLLLLLPDLPLAAQFIVFAVTMLASISLGFAVQRRGERDPAKTPVNQELQDLVGQRCEAATDFDTGRGRIRVRDTTYGAKGADEIRAGDIVVITAIEEGGLVVGKDVPAAV